MKVSTFLFAAIVAASLLSVANSFGIRPPTTATTVRHRSTTFTNLYATTTTFEGKPTERAMNMDLREQVRKGSFFNVNGDSVTIDELIGTPSESGVSIVVFLRSLG